MGLRAPLVHGGLVRVLEVLTQRVLGDAALATERACVAEGQAVLAHRVVPQGARLAEGRPTLAAHVRPLARVGADVLRQGQHRGAAALADLAGEGLAVPGGAVPVGGHLVCRQAALELEAEVALVAGQGELPALALALPARTIPARLPTRVLHLGAVEHHRAVGAFLAVRLLVPGQVVCAGEDAHAPLAAPAVRVGVLLHVARQHGLALKQAVADGTLVALALLVHGDVGGVSLGADEPPGAVGAVLAPHGAVVQPLVPRQLPHLGKAAGTLAALEHLAVLAPHVHLHAAPVERHKVALRAPLLQGLHRGLFLFC